MGKIRWSPCGWLSLLRSHASWVNVFIGFSSGLICEIFATYHFVTSIAFPRWSCLNAGTSHFLDWTPRRGQWPWPLCPSFKKKKSCEVVKFGSLVGLIWSVMDNYAYDYQRDYVGDRGYSNREYPHQNGGGLRGGSVSHPPQDAQQWQAGQYRPQQHQQPWHEPNPQGGWLFINIY